MIGTDEYISDQTCIRVYVTVHIAAYIRSTPYTGNTLWYITFRVDSTSTCIHIHSRCSIPYIYSQYVAYDVYSNTDYEN